MVPFDELERRWSELPPLSTERGLVHMIVVRTGDGEHALPPRVELSPEGGIHGDRWLVTPTRTEDGQISFIEARVADLLVGGDPARRHLPGDNFQVDLDLSEAALPVGSRLRLGTALIEITGKPHLGCAKFNARVGADALRWVNIKSLRARRLRGVFGRVLEAGSVGTGDALVVESRPA